MEHGLFHRRVAASAALVAVGVGSWFTAAPASASAAPRSISTSYNHACAVTGEGTVKCWGVNGSGQLGDGTRNPSTRPVTVVGLTGVRQVEAGRNFTCALLDSGTVRCWGANNYGQLGDGTTTERLAPVSVQGLSGIQEISAGFGHVCASTSGDGARCWGYNIHGQLGDGTTTNRSRPVAVKGLPVGDWPSSIAVGEAHSCATNSDHRVRCWGLNQFGQLGDGTFTNRSTAVMVKGILLNGYGRMRASAGGGTSCVAMAPNWWVTTTTTSTTTTSTTAPSSTTTAPPSNPATDEMHMNCWGHNSSGQLGDVQFTGLFSADRVRVDYLTKVDKPSVGGGHACGGRLDGTVMCWGANGSGQLGNGTTVPSAAAKVVPGLNGVTVIASNSGYSCAVAGSGVKCWGDNTFGQLGNGTTTRSLVPVTVAL